MCLLSIGNVFSQNLKWEMDEETSYKIPVGLCTWEELQQSDCFNAIREHSPAVILNSKATVELAKVLESQPNTHYEIDAFFGAWNDESLRFIQPFYVFVKTMEAKYQQPIKYRLIGCNREYECGGLGEPEAMPHFKLYRVTNDGQRTLIGEIKEQPKISFEDDVLNYIKH